MRLGIAADIRQTRDRNRRSRSSLRFAQFTAAPMLRAKFRATWSPLGIARGIALAIVFALAFVQPHPVFAQQIKWNPHTRIPSGGHASDQPARLDRPLAKHPRGTGSTLGIPVRRADTLGQRSANEPSNGAQLNGAHPVGAVVHQPIPRSHGLSSLARPVVPANSATGAMGRSSSLYALPVSAGDRSPSPSLPLPSSALSLPSSLTPPANFTDQPAPPTIHWSDVDLALRSAQTDGATRIDAGSQSMLPQLPGPPTSGGDQSPLMPSQTAPGIATLGYPDQATMPPSLLSAALATNNANGAPESIPAGAATPQTPSAGSVESLPAGVPTALPPSISSSPPPPAALPPTAALPPAAPLASAPASPGEGIEYETPGYITKALETGHSDYGDIYPPPPSPWEGNFSSTPMPADAVVYSDVQSRRPYDSKYANPVQRPLIEWGRPLYLNGIYPPSDTLFGKTNLMQQHFYMYGDYRSGYGGGTNAAGDFHNYASQFNLDFDWGLTSTERLHTFIRPFDRNGNFTGFNFVNGIDYQRNYNIDFLTGFFEGDLGAISGGLTGSHFPFDLPFTVGLIPLLFQNGIWMEDAVAGAAFSLPAKNSRVLNWANFDATFFAGFDNINSDAFPKDVSASQVFGTAWFVDAYEGYFESGYAYLRDRNDSARSYHNITLSFARRYFWRVSNAVRVIANVGQTLPHAQRTADGVLVIVENAWSSSDVLRLVPYTNFFAGFGRPQSVARAGLAGGVLRNTGINFESDNLNGYPTLDPTARNTYGGAIGVNLLGTNLDHQWIVEGAFVGVMDDVADTNAGGNQAGIGTRYQRRLTYRTLIRLDGMYGFRDNKQDLVGGRIEYRWKF